VKSGSAMSAIRADEEVKADFDFGKSLAQGFRLCIVGGAVLKLEPCCVMIKVGTSELV